MSILSILSKEQLQRQRRWIKRVAMAGWPEHLKTDREADRILESYNRRIIDEGEQMMMTPEDRRTISIPR